LSTKTFSEMTSVNRQVAPNRAREDRDLSQHSKTKRRGCELAWSRDLIYANVQIFLWRPVPRQWKGWGSNQPQRKRGYEWTRLPESELTRWKSSD
jgi:hypothetical protein